MKQKLFLLSLLLFSIFAVPKLVFAQENSISPVYRFWSGAYQSHFFTISEIEKNHVINTYAENEWKYEGIAYYAFTGKSEDTAPIYRFWSNLNKSHFFTISEIEKNHVINTYAENEWKYEGIAYYAYPEKKENMASAYRFWSNQNRSHFYTATPREKTCVINKYSENEWHYEGVGWYLPPNGLNLSDDDPYLCLSVGPDIRVGVWGYKLSDIESGTGHVRITANMNYAIKNNEGTVIAVIPAGKTTRIRHLSDGDMTVYNSIPEIIVGQEVSFESADGNVDDIIFETNKPGWQKYRGKMSLKYSDTNNNKALAGGESKRIWLINTLPMEHYVWGMGEITGTGAMEYNNLMTISFRSYGHFWLNHATKYIPEGFTVNATPGNQLYYGYDYEVKYPRIKEAAQYTGGNILISPKSNFSNNLAISPYGSWTDGKTRNFPDGHWNGNCNTSPSGNISSLYPWLLGVNDAYGKHSTRSTCDLAAGGNHMVGLSANGALRLATDHGWKHKEILQYYFSDVDLLKIY